MHGLGSSLPSRAPELVSIRGLAFICGLQGVVKGPRFAGSEGLWGSIEGSNHQVSSKVDLWSLSTRPSFGILVHPF